MTLVIGLLINIVLSWLIADALGRKRNIGFSGSFTLSILLGFLIGLIITLCSSRLDNYSEKQSNSISEQDTKELLKLKQLKDKGILTDDEFNKKKSEILHTTIQNNNSINKPSIIYLKNGTEIKGIIIDEIPNISVKIKTVDGYFFVNKMDEIEKIVTINDSETDNKKGDLKS